MLLPRPEPHANAPPPCSPYLCTLSLKNEDLQPLVIRAPKGWPHRFMESSATSSGVVVKGSQTRVKETSLAVDVDLGGKGRR